MYVQHPEKSQFEVVPVDRTQPSFLTDERGIADVSPALGKALKAQGWTEVKTKPKDSDPVAPAVEVPEDVVTDDSNEEK